jgi:hypothetical protein
MADRSAVAWMRRHRAVLVVAALVVVVCFMAWNQKRMDDARDCGRARGAALVAGLPEPDC